MSDPIKCTICDRGKEACSYCQDCSESDWEAICDCGLYDFGSHLMACEDRKEYRWVITDSHKAAEEKIGDA